MKTQMITKGKSKFSFRKLGFVLFTLFLPILVNAQPWTYDFGTGTGSFTSSTASTIFLPTPPTGGGTARVRCGTNPGSFTLANSGLAGLGTGSELQFTSNTGSTSTSKFSVYGYTASKVGYFKSSIVLNGGTNGVYILSIGSGANFSDNNSIGTAQIFAGIQWSLGATNTITYKVLNNTTWGTTGITNSTTLFTQSTSNVYNIEVYYNNTTSSASYSRLGTSYSLANATWDLWVNDTLKGTGLAKGAYTANTNIDSYAFNHQVSASAPGTLYIDDIEYSNALPILTPSIVLSSTSPAVPTANLTQSTTKNPIYKFSTAVTTADATLNSVAFTTTNTAADVTKYQLWYKSTDDFSTATQIGTDITTALGTGSHTFAGLTQAITSGNSGYFWITADIAAAATPANTIVVSAITTSDLTFAAGTKSGTASAGGTQTIIAASSPSLGTTALADFGSQCINSTYGPNSFTLTGSSLTTSAVIVGALTGYTYSTTSGGAYTTTLSITPSSGSINQDVYVKFSPLAVQSYDGNIAISGGGASSINRSVTGSGVYTAPVVTSAAANPIVNTTATLNGSVTTLGVCPATTEKGFVYSVTSTNADPIVGGAGVTKTSVAGLATGAFTLALTGLTPNTGYSFKSYLYDGSTYTYGTVTTFSTLAAASKLVFSVSPPATGFVNTNLASFTVQAQRADNSVDAEYTGNIVITKATGSGAISGTLTVAAVAGVASFTTVKFDATDTYTITASSGSLTTVTSGNILINPTPTTIAAWDFTGVGTASLPTYAATTFSSNLVSSSGASNISRGGNAAWSTGGNSFRTVGFKNEGIDVANTDYFQVTLTPATGNKMSLATIDAKFAGTAGFYATPGVTSQFAYSTNGTSFTLIGLPVQSTSLTLNQIDLSGISALQNISAGTTITLRYYASGQTATGGWGFQSAATAGTNGLAIGGNITAVPADIALSDNGTQVVAANVLQGTNNQILSTYKLAVTNSNATLNEADFITSGNYQATDINGSGFKLWYSSTNSFAAATAIGSALTSTSTGSGDILQFTTLNQLIKADSTGYFWVTANIATGATVGRTISIDAIANADLLFSSGNKSGSTTAGGTQTFIAPTLPTISIGGTVTAFSNQCINTTSSEKSFTVTGSNLTDDITITVPAGFEISKTSGSNFGSSVTLLNSGGNVSLTTIYVRFVPTLAQLYSVNITCSTTGGSDQLVAISGTGTYTAPAVTSSAATNMLTTTATINGNVTTLGVCPNTIEKGFVYSITSANANPIVGGTGVTKTAVAGLVSGAFLLNLTGLTASTGYTFKSYLYDGSTYTYGSALTFSTSAPCPSATLPFVENFEYSNTASLTSNCWVAHNGGGTNPIKASTSSITYPGYLSSGIGNEVTLTTNGEDDNIAFASQNSGTVYASFLVNVTSASTTGDYFAHFGGTAGAGVTTFYDRLFVKKDASSNLAFGISKNNGTVGYTTFSYALNTTYLVVLKYSFVSGTTNDISELFISPVLNKPIPTATVSAGDIATTADAAQVTSFCLRQGTTTIAPAVKFDGIRISNNWYDIVGNTIVLSSTAGTDNQTSCINTPITNITYTTTGATGATFSGLPAGVNGSWNANVVTISGTPSVANTFNYTVTLTGGTGNGTTTGTIIVNDLPTASISYSSASYNTSVNTPQTVTLNGTGTYTGGTYSASPAGLTIDQNSGAITPSTSSLNVYTVTYSIPASGGCGIVNVTTQVTITAPVVATTTFTGTGNWNNAGLWDFGIPTASTHAIINGSCTVTASATCKNLTINPAKDLTVNAGQALAVTGQFLIKSTAAGTGSYINNGSVTYSLTPKVERYITQTVWHLITSPVQSAVSGLWSGLYLKDYNEATNTFNAPFSSTSVPLTVGKGFAIWSAATTGNATRTYTGNLNNSDYPISLVWSGNAAHGYNLIGNMYTSAITGDINNWTKVNVNNSIYVWNGANYLTWNGTAGTLASGIIPAGQGFLVQANGAAASVTIQKSKRVHNSTLLYKHTNANTLNVTAKANSLTDALVVYFEPNATIGYDPTYDVMKLNGSNGAPQIATVADGGTKLSINALPAITTYSAIPLSFDCTVSGTDTLVFDGADSFDPSLEVRIVDLSTNNIVDLRTHPILIFSHTYNPNITEPRFNLLFGTNTVGIGENSGDLTIFASNRKINIMNPKLVKIAQIGVYNSLGQLVKLINSPATTSRIEVNADFSPGIYIVKAVDESGKIEIKKVNIN